MLNDDGYFRPPVEISGSARVAFRMKMMAKQVSEMGLPASRATQEPSGRWQPSRASAPVLYQSFFPIRSVL